MRKSLLFTIAALVCLYVPLRADDPAPPKGFTALFNGKDLTGWKGIARDAAGFGAADLDPYKLASMTEAERKTLLEKWAADGNKLWRVEKGELVNDGNSAYLMTDRKFGDFELLLECKAEPKSNYHYAHIDFRGTQLIFENREWERIRIVIVGERVTAYKNGELLRDHKRQPNIWKQQSAQPLPPRTAIRLTTNSGAARWRNIFIREIPSTEANEILRGKNAKGFADVFNGKDLSGWAGPIDQYEVKDGAIVCKPHKGGTIFTKAEYADFVARLEYRLPPGGNNGLAIRYPGKGDTAYVGMCEIQVLDDTAKQYAKLDQRQYNGSAYGMAPAHRGYLRPVGEWNFEEVTIKGSTIKVELNGTLILDTDLSKVTDYMAKSPHPGKMRAKGHFGFAGHSDPVAFRRIQIRVLD